MSETFLILERNERNIVINMYRPSCKVPVILVSGKLVNCIFSINFRKIL